MRVLGLDPGLRHTGWGVIEVAGSQLSFVAAGCASPEPQADLAVRLAAIHHDLAALIQAHRPESAAIEETVVNRHAQASLKLGAARGVAMTAAALAGLRVAEYAPRTVKKALVGGGQADKAQIGHMVAQLLPGHGPWGEDATDALAVAICHAHHARFDRLAGERQTPKEA